MSVIEIVADTREQRIPPFPAGVTVVRECLAEGDYTTRALYTLARIERKSGADLAASLTRGRERFDRELVRLEKYPHRLVLVEADLGDYYSGAISTQMHPSALIGSVASLYARHGVPVIFAHSPAIVGRLVAGILCRLEEQYAGTVAA